MIEFLQKHRPKIFALGLIFGLFGYFFNGNFLVIGNSLLIISMVFLFFE